MTNREYAAHLLIEAADLLNNEGIGRMSIGRRLEGIETRIEKNMNGYTKIGNSLSNTSTPQKNSNTPQKNSNAESKNKELSPAAKRAIAWRKEMMKDPHFLPRSDPRFKDRE